MTFVDESALDGVCIIGFDKVQRMADLRTFVFQSGLPVSLVNPKMIVDVFHIQVATLKALQNIADKTMRTKQFGTEILYWLSPSTQITESLKTYGVSEADESVIIVCGREHIETVKAQVQGEETELSDLLTSDCDIKYALLSDASCESLKTPSLMISKAMTKEYVN